MRFVNTATAQWIASARCSSSAWLETSIAHGGVAAVEHLGERGLQVDRLGRRARERCPRGRRRRSSRSPAAPVRRPAASSSSRTRNAVVVLPFVPVMPTTSSRAVGIAVQAGGGGRHRGADVVDEDLGHAEPERVLDDQRHGAARDRVGREVVAVAREAAHAEEQRAGRDAACRRTRGSCTSRVALGVREELAQPHRPGTLAGRDPEVRQGERRDRARRRARRPRRRRCRPSARRP